MSQHTKSPWQFNPSRGDITAPGVTREESRMGGAEVWNYYGGEVVAETVSACDGQLLAAAPELLAALKRVMANGAFHTSSFEQAKAAIAKAEAKL